MKIARLAAPPIALALGLAALVAPAGPAASQDSGAGDDVRSICYPVEGGPAVAPYSDTFGAPRGGGTRSHAGDDLMGPKMARLLSTVDGTVREIVYDNASGNRVVVQDDDGWFYVYLHVNNDTPGSDDGAAARDQVFAPGLAVGQRVSRCQHIAFLGDSGNAEATAPHLHFEIRRPVTSGDPARSWAWSSATPVNPTPSLRAATSSGSGGSSSGSSGSTGGSASGAGGSSSGSAATGKWAPFVSVSELVTRQYLDFYGRSPDSGGAQYWTGRLTSGAETPTTFIGRLLTAPEFEARVAPVARLYWAYFDRIPDTDGLLHWVHETGHGATLGQVSQAFAGSAEFRGTYGSLSDAEFVRLVYANVLDRQPDAAGESYWTDRLARRQLDRGAVMIGFSESPEYRGQLASKVRVVLAYVAMLERSPDPGGLEHWSSRGVTGLVEGVFASPEYASRVAAKRR